MRGFNYIMFLIITIFKNNFFFIYLPIVSLLLLFIFKNFIEQRILNIIKLNDLIKANSLKKQSYV